jgi:transcriptional regulator with XRE-family HTH domain
MADRASLQALGRSVQKLREAKGLTLEELSRQSGVSSGFLSQTERGLGNPSFGTLMKIATALQVSPAALFDSAQAPSSFMLKKKDRQRFKLPGALVERLTPALAGINFDMSWLEIESGSKGRPISHAGAEAGVILKGTLHAHIGGQTYMLEPGDSIAFPSTLPHWFHNQGDTPVVKIWVHVMDSSSELAENESAAAHVRRRAPRERKRSERTRASKKSLSKSR